MQHIGVTNLPLHGGNAPKWLFKRMVKLGGAISEMIIDEFRQDEYIKRLSDPYFFQALGCALAYDWHSSGLTTTTCGALKLSLNKSNLGIKICGGKGKTSRKTPDEIKRFSDEFNINENKRDKLVYSSRMSAKVDSVVLQDNYQLYHHCFIMNENGNWCVIQQGMNSENRYARRYHWLSSNVDFFVNEPHNAICCNKKEENILNMAAKESEETRKISVDLVNDDYFSKFNVQKTINDFTKDNIAKITFPKNHYIINMKKRNLETLKKAYEIQPKNYEELIAIKGIGPKTVRSLALISDLIYGSKPSWKDPVKYSFALGGKDRIPYEINRKHYDETTEILESAIDNAKVGDKEKLFAIKRLKDFLNFSCFNPC